MCDCAPKKHCWYHKKYGKCCCAGGINCVGYRVLGSYRRLTLAQRSALDTARASHGTWIFYKDNHKAATHHITDASEFRRHLTNLGYQDLPPASPASPDSPLGVPFEMDSPLSPAHDDGCDGDFEFFEFESPTPLSFQDVAQQLQLVFGGHVPSPSNARAWKRKRAEVERVLGEHDINFEAVARAAACDPDRIECSRIRRQVLTQTGVDIAHTDPTVVATPVRALVQSLLRESGLSTDTGGTTTPIFKHKKRSRFTARKLVLE